MYQKRRYNRLRLAIEDHSQFKTHLYLRKLYIQRRVEDLFDMIDLAFASIKVSVDLLQVAYERKDSLVDVAVGLRYQDQALSLLSTQNRFIQIKTKYRYERVNFYISSNYERYLRYKGYHSPYHVYIHPEELRKDRDLAFQPPKRGVLLALLGVSPDLTPDSVKAILKQHPQGPFTILSSSQFKKEDFTEYMEIEVPKAQADKLLKGIEINQQPILVLKRQNRVRIGQLLLPHQAKIDLRQNKYLDQTAIASLLGQRAKGMTFYMEDDRLRYSYCVVYQNPQDNKSSPQPSYLTVDADYYRPRVAVVVPRTLRKKKLREDEKTVR